MADPVQTLRPLLVYTMTSGLGDFIVMGDLARKVEKLRPGAQCLFVHRGNPHVSLWPEIDRQKRFFNIYSVGGMALLLKRLRECSLDGYTIFGIQMAPGSLQGFLLYALLKKMQLIDYIVDFNLINADIITPPKGAYILDLHLNQAAQLLKVEVPGSYYALNLPFDRNSAQGRSDCGAKIVGIHPWSRRGDLSCFVWPFEKWLCVITRLLELESQIVVFGRDKSFGAFERFLQERLGTKCESIEFRYSHTVSELGSTIEGLDLLLSVNTSVVHIGYALRKSMVILSGPSLDLWIPKHDSIRNLSDPKAWFSGSDKWTDDERFAGVDRIETSQVIEAMESLLLSRSGCT